MKSQKLRPTIPNVPGNAQGFKKRHGGALKMCTIDNFLPYRDYRRRRIEPVDVQYVESHTTYPSCHFEWVIEWFFLRQKSATEESYLSTPTCPFEEAAEWYSPTQIFVRMRNLIPREDCTSLLLTQCGNTVNDFFGSSRWQEYKLYVTKEINLYMRISKKPCNYFFLISTTTLFLNSVI